MPARRAAHDRAQVGPAAHDHARPARARRHRVVLVASKGGDDRDPQWYRNLSANPDVEVAIDGDTRKMRARTASPEEKAALWPDIVAAYKGYDSYQKTSRPRHPRGDLRAAHGLTVSAQGAGPGRGPGAIRCDQCRWSPWARPVDDGGAIFGADQRIRRRVLRLEHGGLAAGVQQHGSAHHAQAPGLAARRRVGRPLGRGACRRAVPQVRRDQVCAHHARQRHARGRRARAPRCSAPSGTPRAGSASAASRWTWPPG